MKQQFNGIVERCRIAGVRHDDGANAVYVIAKHFVAKQLLPGAHPRDVAAEGVDLSVVTQHVERLCQLPRRKRIRAEALMYHGQGTGHAFVAEVLVEAVELLSEQQALVHDGPARKTR